jgi:hypothetical protein
MSNVFGPTFGAELYAALTAAGQSTNGVSADLITGAVYYNGVPVAASGAPSALKSVVASVVSAHDNSAVDRHAAAAAALAAGIAITSTGTPSISGVYGTAMQDEINLTGLQASINAGVPFLSYLRDKSGVKHTMTATQFTALASAVLAYIAAVDAYVAGDTASLLAASATIP